MSKSPQAFRTIREVAEWLGVAAHVLRFWESKFTQIKPVKRAGGRRYYRPADMALVGGIKVLLHDQGLTIRGVQKMIREEGVAHIASLSPPFEEAGTEALNGAWEGDHKPGNYVLEMEPVTETAPPAEPVTLSTGPASEAETATKPASEPAPEPEPIPAQPAPPEPEDIAETDEQITSLRTLARRRPSLPADRRTDLALALARLQTLRDRLAKPRP
ncbi:MerR family transcriptional regulator [Rhodophyticola sp. CCM32]|uniref:MerR family transcriptional regulator n=1 Tax=Rhodophyticola sp. CCM32 TaxID=2916397 RepID=UPI00107F3B16|nr:MerR family transcriptional regulator [Rhodophyticola sp. CCM32]QBY00757.1 MerR family transcriptional regulator [Rhodophyticola sp. CCM32]